MIDYGNFRSALKNLEVQHEHLQHLPPDFPAYIQEAMAESVIQRFETCYDTLWKVLKRYLVEELGIAEVPNSPRPIFRLAGENFLLSAGGDQWEVYAKVRIDTSHDYNREKAANAIAVMPGFIGDAINLYTVMTGERWE